MVVLLVVAALIEPRLSSPSPTRPSPGPTWIERRLSLQLDLPVVIRYGTRAFSITAREAGLRLDAERIARAAASGDSGNLEDALEAAVEAAFQAVASPGGSILLRRLKPVLADVERAPADARWALLPEEPQPVLVPEQPGVTIDLQSLLKGIARAILEASAGTGTGSGISAGTWVGTGTAGPGDNSSPVLELPLKAVKPRVTAARLRESGLREPLALFETRYGTQDLDRSANVERGAARLNGRQVEPGQVFSASSAYQPVTAEAGYRLAPVIIDGRLVPGIGGGLSQVTTTLFNAAALAGMEILEARNHSMPVSYVPVGRDVTVWHDQLDFRFRNPLPHPVQILARAEEGTLRIALVGTRTANLRYELSTREVERIPYPVQRVPDPALAPGEEVEEEPGSWGLVVETWRTAYQGDRPVRRERLLRSVYPPQERRVRVGPLAAGSREEIGFR